MWAELAGLVVTGSLVLLLLPRFGIVGAALGSFLGYQTIALMLILQAKRIVRKPVIDFLIPVAADMRLIRQGFATFLPVRLKNSYSAFWNCFA